jgi:hypothetical protein
MEAGPLLISLLIYGVALRHGDLTSIAPGGGFERIDAAPEIIKRALEAFAERDARLPAQESASAGYVRAAAGGVVLGESSEVDGRFRASDGEDLAGAFEDCELVGVADIDGQAL